MATWYAQTTSNWTSDPLSVGGIWNSAADGSGTYTTTTASGDTCDMNGFVVNWSSDTDGASFANAAILQDSSSSGTFLFNGTAALSIACDLTVQDGFSFLLENNSITLTATAFILNNTKINVGLASVTLYVASGVVFYNNVTFPAGNLAWAVEIQWNGIIIANGLITSSNVSLTVDAGGVLFVKSGTGWTVTNNGAVQAYTSPGISGCSPNPICYVPTADKILNTYFAGFGGVYIAGTCDVNGGGGAVILC